MRYFFDINIGFIFRYETLLEINNAILTKRVGKLLTMLDCARLAGQEKKRQSSQDLQEY